MKDLGNNSVKATVPFMQMQIKQKGFTFDLKELRVSANLQFFGEFGPDMWGIKTQCYVFVFGFDSPNRFKFFDRQEAGQRSESRTDRIHAGGLGEDSSSCVLHQLQLDFLGGPVNAALQ